VKTGSVRENGGSSLDSRPGASLLCVLCALCGEMSVVRANPVRRVITAEDAEHRGARGETRWKRSRDNAGASRSCDGRCGRRSRGPASPTSQQARDVGVTGAATLRPGAPRHNRHRLCALCVAAPTRRGSTLQPTRREYAVDEAVLHGFLGGHEEVAIGVFADLLHRFAPCARPRIRDEHVANAKASSSVWILTSAAKPWAPPNAWCSRMRELGSAERLPGAPR